MENRKRNVTALGLMVLSAAAIFVWGFYYMLGTPVLGGGTRIFVAIQNGAGLKRGDRVFLQGVDVGSVTGVHLESPGRVAVPDGMFSTSPTTPTALSLALRRRTISLISAVVSLASSAAQSTGGAGLRGVWS